MAAISGVDWLPQGGILAVRFGVLDLRTAEVAGTVGRNNGVRCCHARSFDLVNGVQFSFVVIVWVYVACSCAVGAVNNVVGC